MKRYLFLVAAAVCLVACHPNPTPDPDYELSNVRTVVYTVDHNESRASLGTDAEWDQMLDNFCSLAKQGSEVVFYSMATVPEKKSKGSTFGNEKPESITTSDRKELKDWMKTMERRGKTVTVVYHEPTGTWTGTATATAPQTQQRTDCYVGNIVMVAAPATDRAAQDDAVYALQVNDDSLLILMEGGQFLSYGDALVFYDDFSMDESGMIPYVAACGAVEDYTDINNEHYLVLNLSAQESLSIIGSWQYLGMTETRVEYNISPVGIRATTSIAYDEGNLSVYSFSDEGKLTVASSDGTNHFSYTTGEQGEICSEGLGEDDGCWVITWLTSSTLILTRAVNDEADVDVFYTMEFAFVRR